MDRKRWDALWLAITGQILLPLALVHGYERLTWDVMLATSDETGLQSQSH